MTMTARIGINGYGRIGRVVHRILLDRGDADGVAVAAVNDPAADAKTFAFLLEHDSVYGTVPHHVESNDSGFAVAGQRVAVLAHTDPAAIPWGNYGVEVVVECSGRFTAREQAAAHLHGGVHHVLISAPSKDADATVCLGVNDSTFDPTRHRVIANASCTTNCLAPMARVLDDRFGIKQGYMTTIHAYTTGQSLLDVARVGRSGKADVRRMRAAPLSIVPTSTGATRAVAQVLPQLQGRLNGIAMRVPVPDGSIVDLVATVRGDVQSVDELNLAFADAANDNTYRGVLDYTDKPLVSADIVGNPASCVFSSTDTMASPHMVKVFGWYDNEWGYASRLADLVDLVLGNHVPDSR
jgi:glyceraldehyde 3-phosphate dehydrogenase